SCAGWGAVQRYAGLVGSAGGNSRQGFPVGAAYLDQASAALRTEVLPTLDEVAVSTSERVDTDMGAVSLAQLLLVLVLLALVALAVVQVWLARRTHRVLNTGLAAASAALLVGAVVTAAAVLGGNGMARSVASGPYAATVATSQALSLATDAKSMESFTLIKRGSGAQFEKSYQESLAEAARLLDSAASAGEDGGSDLRGLLDAWDTEHAAIRELDDAGTWDEAVEAATSPADDSAGAAFTAFSDAAHADVESTSTAAVDRLGSAATTTRVAAWIALVLGVAGAVAAAAGMNVRLKEYRREPAQPAARPSPRAWRPPCPARRPRARPGRRPPCSPARRASARWRRSPRSARPRRRRRARRSPRPRPRRSAPTAGPPSPRWSRPGPPR